MDTDVFCAIDSTWKADHGIQGKYVILGFANKFLLPENREVYERVGSLCDDKTAFVVAGCSEEQISQLPQNVIGIGKIANPHEMAKLYSMADIMVNVTWEDSLSLVNVEALACGTPVITYASCGAAETVEEGYRIEPGNVENLIEKIKEIRKIGRQRVSEACRHRAVNMFSNTYREYSQTICAETIA